MPQLSTTEPAVNHSRLKTQVFCPKAMAQSGPEALASRNPARTSQNTPKPPAMARMARKAPLPGRYFPNMTISRKAMKLKAGISQASSASSIYLTTSSGPLRPR